MSTPTVLTNAVIAIDGEEATATANNVKLSLSGDTKDATTFKSGGWKVHKPGLAMSAFNVDGLVSYDENDQDAQSFARLLEFTNSPVTLAEEDAAGAVAYLLETARAQLGFGAPVGELARYQAAGDGDGAAARGALIEVTAEAGITGAHVSAAVLVAEGTRLVAHVHIIAAGSDTTTYTPTLDWARDGGGASGSVAGTAITGTGSYRFDIPWPDPGNDVDVNIDVAVSDGLAYRTILAAGATP